MGYVVYYVPSNGKPRIERSTYYGATKKVAANKMKEILMNGHCAWISPVDPELVGNIPF